MRIQSLGQENPLEKGMKNPMNRGAWRAIVHEVAQSQTTEATYHACIT